jgi:hypothetical protein
MIIVAACVDIDLAALLSDVDTLHQLVRDLAAQVADDRSELAQAQAEIERLKLIIRRFQRAQFGRYACLSIYRGCTANVSLTRGVKGHKVVGAIAIVHLTDSARQQVENLLGSDLQQFIEVATWGKKLIGASTD